MWRHDVGIQATYSACVAIRPFEWRRGICIQPTNTEFAAILASGHVAFASGDRFAGNRADAVVVQGRFGPMTLNYDSTLCAVLWSSSFTFIHDAELLTHGARLATPTTWRKT